MDIGKESPAIEVEPLEDPFPKTPGEAEQEQPVEAPDEILTPA